MCESEGSGGLYLGSLVGMLAGSKAARRVLFWTVAVPMLPFALWAELGWLGCSLIAALAAVLSAVGVVVLRRLHGHTVLARPELTPEMREALAARGLKAIPAPGQRAARPALPRAMRAQLGRGRLTATVTGVRPHKPAQALPAAQKALPAPAEVLEGVPAKLVPVASQRRSG